MMPTNAEKELWLERELAEAKEEIVRVNVVARHLSTRIRDLTHKYERAQEALLQVDRRYRKAESGHSGLASDLQLIAARAIAPEEEIEPKRIEPGTDTGCDRGGSAFIRDAGVPCRKCGVVTQPKYMGNALACYVCPICGDEIDP